MSGPVSRDFDPSAAGPVSPTDVPSSPISVDLEAGPGTGAMATGASPSRPRSHSITFNTSGLNKSPRHSGSNNAERDAEVVRRMTRSNTVRNYQPGMADSQMSVVWEEPATGAEPGIDTTKDPEPQYAQLKEVCQITLVDFSGEKMTKYEMDNAELIDFLETPREHWVQCRWINVNGLSYDVIQALGNKYSLHRLAIEDMLDARGRTKVDWYSDHAFVHLTLQKLVRLTDEYEEKLKKRSKSALKRWYNQRLEARRRKRQRDQEKQTSPPAHLRSRASSIKSIVDAYEVQKPPSAWKTLHRSRGGTNLDRALFMERNSPLTEKNLAVSVEKVSLFLTADNTVVAFFEHSADDVEGPILTRLMSQDTILRRSCDASMMLHAIIDAMVDLFFAVSAAYEEVMSELEMDVLTDPSLSHSRMLYIVSSELYLLRNNMQPILNVINALREHKHEEFKETASGSRTPAKKSASIVGISPVAHTYLGDIEDHCLLITSNLDAMRTGTQNMIDLIFNQVSAFQNETMKILTNATVFFLPLTFLTGYFGQNFADFPAPWQNERLFWNIAIPVMVGTFLILFIPLIKRHIMRVGQKVWIAQEKARLKYPWNAKKER